jgi:uncharacterized protein (DUF305 family)
MRIQAKLFSAMLLSGLSFGFAACGGDSAITMMDHSDHAETMANHGGHEMDLGPRDEYFDLRFIDGMILHHEGAIAMAEDAQANSERAEIQALAEEIISAQELEIAQMQQWRQEWYPAVAETPMMYHAEANHMMPMSPEMAAAMRMDVDLGPADEAFDLRFLEAMIVHHEGAVEMAEQVLERGDRPELLALAEAVIATQQQEIDLMREWQTTWYGEDS